MGRMTIIADGSYGMLAGVSGNSITDPMPVIQCAILNHLILVDS